MSSRVSMFEKPLLFRLVAAALVGMIGCVGPHRCHAIPFRGSAPSQNSPMSNPISKSDFRRVDPRMHLIEEDPVPTGAKSSTNFKNIEKQIVKNLTNSTKAIPRQRMDSQSPEIAEAVNFALNLINKKVEQKRTARVINIIKAFKEAHKLDDDVLYYEATVQLRRANGRIEFQDIKVGKNVNTGKWVMKSHGLRPSAFSMRTRNFGELVTVKRAAAAAGTPYRG